MIRSVYLLNPSGPDWLKLLREEEAEPECGKDFCDSCGDCIHCYAGDKCYGNDGGEHLWVKYVEIKEGTEVDT